MSQNQRIIHILGLDNNTARWSLKMTLEAYGKVEAVNMGDRTNPEQCPCWCKFHAREAAEKCMEALDGGLVMNHGKILRGEWRKQEHEPKAMSTRDIGPEVFTSRDLAP